MKYRYFLLLFWLCSLAIAQSKASETHPTTLVLYRPDCPVCQKFIADWNQQSAPGPLTLVSTTSAEGQRWVQLFAIRSVPTFLVLDGKNQLLRQQKGYRSLDHLMQFLGYPKPPIEARTSGLQVQANCGDGSLDPGEACDDGNGSNNDNCLNNCVLNFCGDGYVNAGVEACDDGNTNNNDGCESDCTLPPSCGNGIVEAGESCDDGNSSNTDNCLNSCVFNFCGDGYVNFGVEACDDGNTNNNDGCESNCTLTPSCGNGVVEAGEQCDGTPGCTSSCTLLPVGTYFIEPSYGVKYIPHSNPSLFTSNRSVKVNPTTLELQMTNNHYFDANTYSNSGVYKANSDGTITYEYYFQSQFNLNKNYPLPIVGNDFVMNLLGDANNPSGIEVRSLANPTLLRKRIIPSDVGEMDFDIFAAALQSDGKILLAGRALTSQGRAIVIRLNSDYSLDTSFNSTGYYKLNYGTDCQARAIALQSNGKIIVAGHRVAPGSQGILFRLNTNGSLDTTFATNGLKTFYYELETQNNAYVLSTQSDVYDMVIDTNDSIYLCGAASLGGLWNSSTLPALNIFTANGALQHKMTDLGNPTNTSLLAVTGTAYTLFRNPATGEIYVGGYSINGVDRGLYIQRFQQNGALDSNFIFKTNANAPYAHYNLSNGEDTVFDMEMQNDGKIVVVGESNKKGFYTRILDVTLGVETPMIPTLEPVLVPNPVVSYLTLHWQQPLTNPLTLTLIDNLGRTVRTTQVQPSSDATTTLQGLEDLSRGLYLIRVESERQFHTLKFLKN